MGEPRRWSSVSGAAAASASAAAAADDDDGDDDDVSWLAGALGSKCAECAPDPAASARSRTIIILYTSCWQQKQQQQQQQLVSHTSPVLMLDRVSAFFIDALVLARSHQPLMSGNIFWVIFVEVIVFFILGLLFVTNEVICYYAITIKRCRFYNQGV